MVTSPLTIIPFLFSACQLSGDSKAPPKITIAATTHEINDGFSKIELVNDNELPTGNISYTISGQSGFNVYLNGSPSGLCSPTDCPNACKDLAPILGGGSCFIYIHSLNLLPNSGDFNVINHAANQTITFDLNKYDRLYVSGGFTNAAGREYVAKFDGTSWSELPQPQTPFNGTIYAINFDSVGNLYASGSFTKSSHKYVAKFDGISWSELPLPQTRIKSTNIYSLKFDKSGNLYASMGFTNLDLSRSGYVNMYNGTSWSPLPPPQTPFNDTIFAINFDSVGNLYASGNFKNSAGQEYVAKFDGTSWSELPQPQTPFNSSIYAINSDSTGNLYASGRFTNTAGQEYVAKFDGTSWSELPQPQTPFNGTFYFKTLELSKNLRIINS